MNNYPLEHQSYIYNLVIPGLFDRKADVISTILKQLTIAAINESYPEPEWLRLYINGFKIKMHICAEAGDYSQEFAHYIPIGAEGIAFEGKVIDIEVALLNLIPKIHVTSTEQ